MTRKSKTLSDASPADSPAPYSDTPRSSSNTPSLLKRKRAVDWSKVNDFEGFTLQPLKASSASKFGKKRKIHGESKLDWRADSLDADIVQTNPFPQVELSETHYHIKPADMWESTQRYRKFTIFDTSFQVGDTIFINPDADEDDPNAAVQGWIAKVLEVRGGDVNHVYLRVYWMYRPEDLPGGRKSYHGRNELIVSNDMAIIDALTVQGPANVIHWQEKGDEREILDRDQLFWRQSYDTWKKPNALSELPKHCIENTPCNPDKLLIQCESCEKWLHGSCLEEDAIIGAYNSHNLEYPEDQIRKAKGRRKKGSRKSHTSSISPLFTAKISTVYGSDQTRLTVTDKRPGQDKSWDVPIRCLSCDEIIEEAAEEFKASSSSELFAPDKDKEKEKDEPKGAISAALSNIASHLPLLSRPKVEDDRDSVISIDAEQPSGAEGVKEVEKNGETTTLPSDQSILVG